MTTKEQALSILLKKDDSKIIEQLFIIVTELDARDCSNNSIESCFRGISWETLCSIGINLFEQLRHTKK